MASDPHLSETDPFRRGAGGGEEVRVDGFSLPQCARTERDTPHGKGALFLRSVSGQDRNPDQHSAALRYLHDRSPQVAQVLGERDD